ncbi:MAG: phosphoribosylpyrophosphate synthetase [Mesonia hippocampi]|uniref:phosphoribosylpyrophosphate synthetase n=1 Tax=Mesonia hippocampi TaxID=1628250 RepID=UPI003F9D2A27
MNSDFDTLSEAINTLKKEGYTEDFNLLEDCIESNLEACKFMPDEFKIDKIYRFEGMSNPGDNAILFAVTTNTNLKGVLVDGYGVSGGQISKQLIDKLHRKK